MEQIFRKVRAALAERNYSILEQLPIAKPAKFNWVRDVFEAINVKDHPELPALIWTDDVKTQTISFGQMSAQCNQLLNYLRHQGIKQGDVILSQLALQKINWMGILATIKGGFQMIPAASILGTQDIVYRFGRMMPQVIIADSENAGKIDEAELLSGKKAKVKLLADGEREGWTSVDIIQNESTEAAAADTKADDPLFLFFTSGTTGMPKVVIHTHFSYPFGHLTTASWIGLKTGDVHYNISQPGWAKFTWSSFFAPWTMGAAIFAFHTFERFQAQKTLSLIEKFKVTTFCAPPTVLRMLIQENLNNYRFSLKECVAAGEPLNPEVIEAWKKGTGITIRDGYGQTESTAMVGNLPGAKIKFGSMGKPLFLYDIVIADEDGQELPISEEGNICVRTNLEKPNGIFKTYLDDEEKRKSVFKHGLYYTGDKAYKDEDGYLWFIGRDDDVIKASDYRVGPFEVESVLQEHESIQESAVVGTPHPVKGFEVKAFIILSKDFEASESLAQDIFAFCRKNLAPYKMPRVLEFVEELPKTISGKIRRVELRALEAERKAKGHTAASEFVIKK